METNEPGARRKRARAMRDAIWISLAGVALFAVGRRRDLRGETGRRASIESALHESEERYRTLVELSPDAILVHSEGRLAFANAAATNLLGARSPDELVGKPALEIVHPDYRAVVSERIRSEVEEGRVAPLMEQKFIRLDGRAIDVEVAGIPVMYRGKPAGQIVVRDVTDRKLAEQQLRESESRYRSLVENIPGIVYIDPLDREPDAVAHDVRNEKVGAVSARDNYGVVLRDDGSVDVAATTGLRTMMRAAR